MLVRIVSSVVVGNDNAAGRMIIAPGRPKGVAGLDGDPVAVGGRVREPDGDQLRLGGAEFEPSGFEVEVEGRQDRFQQGDAVAGLRLVVAMQQRDVRSFEDAEAVGERPSDRAEVRRRDGDIQAIEHLD